MLLSIVECSDYRKYSGKSEGGKKKISSTCEFIGPIVEKNAASMRNYGAQISKGGWLFFIDEDCTVDPKKIENTIHQYPEYDVIGGVYFSDDEKNYFSKVYNEIQRKWLLKGIVGKVEILPYTRHLFGGAFAIKKSVFEELGGFSEEIGWGAEETELLNRLSLLNKKIGISYLLRVRHENTLDFFGFLKRAWKQNFNLTYYIQTKGKEEPLKRVSYMWSNILNLPGIFLFFSTAQLAQLCGRSLRFLRKAK